MKVKIKNKMYELKFAPRELTAVFLTKDEPIEDGDYAFMLLHCPVPKKKKDIEETKKVVIEKATKQFDEFERYLECNKTLHEGDKNEN